MKRNFLFVVTLAAGFIACAQKQDRKISLAEVERIEKALASDYMMGRKAGTEGADKAAAFLAAEFKKAGLQPLKGGSYLQQFAMVRPTPLGAAGEIDGKQLNPGQVIAVMQTPELRVQEKSGYRLEYIRANENLGTRLQEIMSAPQPSIVFVDSAFAARFSRLASLNRPFIKGNNQTAAGKNVLFVLGSYQPETFTFTASQRLEEVSYANVVGILPGKSKPSEQVIFSAHYDHLGTGKPVEGDSIYNGANDDASGTTAVVVLANYFKQLNNNERTLVFAAFTAEEIGGFGSQYFSQQFDPKQVVAMFNIEMIGTESKWGNNSAFITGFDKTNMGAILQQNLQGSTFSFHPDPYPEQQLFYRSDNATLARLGVPAHTISTAKMDKEPYYHSVNDEVETLDLQNMTAIIEAIAHSSRSIVAGKDTPNRVQPETLKR